MRRTFGTASLLFCLGLFVSSCSDVSTDLDLNGTWSLSLVFAENLRDDCPFPVPVEIPPLVVTVSQAEHRIAISGTQADGGSIVFVGSLNDDEVSFGGEQFLANLPVAGNGSASCPVPLVWEDAGGIASSNLIAGTATTDGRIQGSGCYPYNGLFCRFAVQFTLTRVN